jgi:small subunit ribosomal protein S21
MENITKPVEFVVSNDNVVRTLKAVNRYLQKHHILRTTKTKMYFEKPSEKKLRKSKESERRRRKSIRASMHDD